MSALTPGQGESAAGRERDPAAARPHRAHRHSPPRLLPSGEPPPSKAAAASCAGSCRRCLETGRVWARAPHEGLRWQVHKGSWATRRQMPYQRRSSLFKLREASRPTCPRCRAPPAARRRRPQERRCAPRGWPPLPRSAPAPGPRACRTPRPPAAGARGAADRGLEPPRRAEKANACPRCPSWHLRRGLAFGVGEGKCILCVSPFHPNLEDV